MPTTKFKNLIYQLALPLKAPKLHYPPDLIAMGGPLYTFAPFERLLCRHHVMGCAALLRDGDLRTMLYSSSQNPLHIVSEGSMFRVASITKMATALAAMVAIKEGKLSLGEPVLSFFLEKVHCPELKGITLTHLLSHTSGLYDPDGMEQALIQGIPFPEVMKNCRKTEPGTSFHYSNLGFGLVGCLLEAVYNLPVAEIMRQLVFVPLEMNATLDASTLEEEKIVPITRVLPYHPSQDLKITPLGAIPQREPDPLRHYGYTAGAMYIDLFSLEKLLLCLMADGVPLLPPEMGQEMIQKRAEYGKISPTLSYGLGILRIEDPSLSPSVILGHQGFAYGCADGAFWEADTGRMVLFLNGGASEARRGRLGYCNYDVLQWALKKEMPKWHS